MKEASLYRPIIKRAWAITKKSKKLWFFGLFAALLGSEFELIQKIFSDYGNFRATKITWAALKNGWREGFIQGETITENLWLILTNHPGALIGLIVVLAGIAGLIIFFLWLAVVSQIGLINGVNLANQNRRPLLNKEINAAGKKFWPVLAINAALKIILVIILVLLAKEKIIFGCCHWLSYLGYGLIFAATVIAIIIISFVIRYQICYLILKNQKIIPGLKSAWRLFLKNWLISLEMGLILFLIYFLAALATLFLTIALLAIPFLLAIYYIPFWLAVVISLITLAALAATTFLITAVFNTFQWSCWVLLFNRLTGGRGISKIIRASRKIPGLVSK